MSVWTILYVWTNYGGITSRNKYTTIHKFSRVFYAQKCFKRINKNGGQRHHRQRVHARVAGSAKSERGVNALGGHLFRVRGVYESFWRVDGDLEERERRENKDRVCEIDDSIDAHQNTSRI